MSINLSTPWHKASFDIFTQDRLPQLLAERLPLAGYHVEPAGSRACRVEVTLASTAGDVKIEYPDLPQPDEGGLFTIDGEPRVVVPTASHEELDTATIRCAGEQLYDYIEERLGQSPPDLPWDATLARAWLPLDTWLDEFMHHTAQRLDTTNWISHHTHLRRLIVLDHEHVVTAGQASLVCPFEMPEGPNLGRVFTIALGAEIRAGKLVVVDERPEANLGLTASMIPLLEHNDANRLLMGANMMRQGLIPPDPEPALVQTGNEPDAPGFWTGRNLLTAFVSWGVDTFYDGIVISQSCAQRLNFPYPAEPGDKLSNRHGTKGVVSQILPDDEMPHLPDGTPVELVFNFSGLHVRMNFGQVREAVLGRIARAEGQPVLAPPFQAPTQDELRERLVQAGLPETGMETLTLGRNGSKLERSSTVGWVYWYRLAHLARSKVRAWVDADNGQMQEDLECRALRDLEAYENLREYLNTRSIQREDAETLATQVAQGPVKQALPPTPMFADLIRRLQVGGIRARLVEDKLTFHFEPPPGETLKLAHPVPHPWLRERELTEIGADAATGMYDLVPDIPFYLRWQMGQPILPSQAYAAIVEANDRLTRMLDSQTPEQLVQDAQAQLEHRIKVFFDVLLTPDHLRLGGRQLFSGRAVIAPGADLCLDQVGLADEIAWTLFGPMVVRELKDEAEVQARSERAVQVLDEVMARSWVIINRAPTISPTGLVAFHPVRNPGPVIRLHPLVCDMLNADFDGDQVAVLLPVTEAAQREAGEYLSVVAHLARDPELLKSLLHVPEALWGLASLNLTRAGRQEIAQMADVELAAPNGPITQTSLAEGLKTVLEREGVEKTLSLLELLIRRGFEVVKASGASISPFIGASLQRSPQPKSDDPDMWQTYKEELAEQIVSGTDYMNDDLGPQLLAVNIRARGRQHLPSLIGPRGILKDSHENLVIARHTLVEGLTSVEMYASVVGARKGLAQLITKMEQMDRSARDHIEASPFTVLARARRAKRPGIVFARAAASGEVDHLLDVDSRLMVGLSVVNRSYKNEY
ncbi:hypothetical protein ACFLXQ_00510 [Chloroflexota bacterium]